MITVYFETIRPKYAEVVAKFESSEIYETCLPALETLCKDQGFDIITESIDDQEL